MAQSQDRQPQQDPADRLHGLLRTHGRRIILLYAERQICRAMSIAGMAAVLLILLDWCTSWYLTLPWMLAPAGLALFGGAIVTLIRRPTRLALAHTIERRHALQDRISTAVIANTEAGFPNEYRVPVTRDAAESLCTLLPSSLFPWRWTRSHTRALLCWGGVVLLFYAPALPWLHSKAQQVERTQVKQAGVHLQTLSRKLAVRPELRRHPREKRLLGKMQKLGAAMARNALSKRESLRQLNRLKAELATQSAAAKQAAAGKGGDEKTAGQTGSSPNAGQSSQGMASLLTSAQNGMDTTQVIMNEQLARQLATGQSLVLVKRTGQVSTRLSQQSNGSGSGSEHGSGNGQGPGKGNRRNGSGRGPDQGGVAKESGGAGYLGQQANERLAAGHSIEATPMVIGKGAALMIPGDVLGGNVKAGRSAVPYYAVYNDYRKRAEHALEEEHIPPADRERVKNYFDALDPGANR